MQDVRGAVFGPAARDGALEPVPGRRELPGPEGRDAEYVAALGANYIVLLALAKPVKLLAEGPGSVELVA